MNSGCRCRKSGRAGVSARRAARLRWMAMAMRMAVKPGAQQGGVEEHGGLRGRGISTGRFSRLRGVLLKAGAVALLPACRAPMSSSSHRPAGQRRRTSARCYGRAFHRQHLGSAQGFDRAGRAAYRRARRHRRKSSGWSSRGHVLGRICRASCAYYRERDLHLFCGAHRVGGHAGGSCVCANCRRRGDEAPAARRSTPLPGQTTRRWACAWQQHARLLLGRGLLAGHGGNPKA